MKKTLRVYIYIAVAALLAAFVLLMGGCAQNKSFDITADAFFAALQERDYAAIYALCSPQVASRITQESMTEQYETIYKTLKVSSVQIERKARNEEHERCVYEYTLILRSEAYGELRFDSSLEVLNKIGFYVLNWSPANIVAPMDWNDSIRYRTLRAARGEIFDCNNKVLVKNTYAVTVYANMLKVGDLRQTAEAVSAALQLDVEETLNKLNKVKASGQDTCVLATYVPGELSEEKEKKALEVEGIRVDRSSITPIRHAVYGDAAAHLIGYSTPVTEEDKADEKYASLSSSTRVGRIGIERTYDDILRGTDGLEIYLLSDTSSNKRVLHSKPAVPGQDIVLTIDIDLQLAISRQMKETFPLNGSTGCAVVNDPVTGAVKALENYPAFDLNIYAAPAAKKEAQQLVTDPKAPLLNRATQGLYPPGSTMKTLISIAGLESGTVRATTAFPYENQIKRIDNKRDGWRPAGSNWSHMIIREHMIHSASYGALDMKRALVFSDNIYFGWLGMEAGADTVISYLEKFGFGQSIPFDLSVQASQISNEKENTRLKSNQKFLADTCCGHGEVLITPLQLLSTFSMYGNAGTVMTPYVLQSINTTDELGRHVVQSSTVPKVYLENVAKASTINTITPFLELVMQDGTGKSARVKGVTVAAKTGTAQKSEEHEIGWFVGYGTSGCKPYAAAVCVDAPKDQSGSNKVGVFKTIFTHLKIEEQA